MHFVQLVKLISEIHNMIVIALAEKVRMNNEQVERVYSIVWCNRYSKILICEQCHVAGTRGIPFPKWPAGI